MRGRPSFLPYWTTGRAARGQPQAERRWAAASGVCHHTHALDWACICSARTHTARPPPWPHVAPPLAPPHHPACQACTASPSSCCCPSSGPPTWTTGPAASASSSRRAGPGGGGRGPWVGWPRATTASRPAAAARPASGAHGRHRARVVAPWALVSTDPPTTHRTSHHPPHLQPPLPTPPTTHPTTATPHPRPPYP